MRILLLTLALVCGAASVLGQVVKAEPNCTEGMTCAVVAKTQFATLTNAQLKSKVISVTSDLIHDARGWQAQDLQLKAKEREKGGKDEGPAAMRQYQRTHFGSKYRQSLIDQANVLHLEVMSRLKLVDDKRSFTTDPLIILHESDHLNTLAQMLP